MWDPALAMMQGATAANLAPLGENANRKRVVYAFRTGRVVTFVAADGAPTTLAYDLGPPLAAQLAEAVVAAVKADDSPPLLRRAHALYSALRGSTLRRGRFLALAAVDGAVDMAAAGVAYFRSVAVTATTREEAAPAVAPVAAYTAPPSANTSTHTSTTAAPSGDGGSFMFASDASDSDADADAVVVGEEYDGGIAAGGAGTPAAAMAAALCRILNSQGSAESSCELNTGEEQKASEKKKWKKI